ncbi:MAG: Trm112 family protein [Planctomycetota bacterium]|nr:MAG: Trm112 family protein [Planctomycetota bacterium]REJ96001.1 MAG: Trm112 family protein [Planctomycetota bacterium]
MSTPEEIGIQLVCPDCRSELLRQPERYVCTDADCRQTYAIVDGIPKMLIDDAETLPEEDWRKTVTGERQG